MELDHVLDLLRRHAVAIQALTAGVTPAQARRRPAPGAWSLLEVVCHLLDEEREDFRVRLDYLLHRPVDDDFPPIDPQGWVTARDYNARDLQTQVDAFLAERERSLAWLATLGDADLDSGREAPWGGTFHAGDMLAAWVAHDVLHLRQLVELHHVLAGDAVAPYNPAYAGDW